jgi:hypothetical protein
MLLDRRNKNMYGLEEGISTVFEKFVHFLFNEGRYNPRMVMNYIPSNTP